MKILNFDDVKKNISSIDTAWQNNETFLFLPEKSGISSGWLNEMIGKIPAHYHENHFILLTSGSTGLPKLVIGYKKRSENLVLEINKRQDIEIAKNTILLLPLTYCYAFVNQWLWSKVYNKQLIQTDGFANPDNLQESLLQGNDSMLCMVGAQVPLIRKFFKEDLIFPGVIRLNFAGGKFPQKDIEFLKLKFPSAEIYNNYGCAEAMPRLTIRAEKESLDGSNIGRPLEGIKLKTSESGEILFNSPYSAVGLVNSEGFIEINKESWTGTGDTGYEVENGYWKIAGRTNEVFKRFGEKIALPNLIHTVSEVWKGEAAFYREQEPNGEEGHVLVVSPHPKEEEYRSILKNFRKNHPRAFWPIRIESIDEIPLLGNGKININELKQNNYITIHWKQRS